MLCPFHKITYSIFHCSIHQSRWLCTLLYRCSIEGRFKSLASLGTWTCPLHIHLILVYIPSVHWKTEKYQGHSLQWFWHKTLDWCSQAPPSQPLTGTVVLYDWSPRWLGYCLRLSNGWGVSKQHKLAMAILPPFKPFPPLYIDSYRYMNEVLAGLAYTPSCSNKQECW